MNNQKIIVSVIGGHRTDGEVEQIAHKVGECIAKVEAVLVCGGLDGVMKAASKGAFDAGGLTIGLLPGKDKADANEFIKIALPTTIGFARNAMVAASGHIIIALPGSHGTLSEICYALVYKRPVIDLGDWKREGMIQIKDVSELEDKLRELIQKIKEERDAGTS